MSGLQAGAHGDVEHYGRPYLSYNGSMYASGCSVSRLNAPLLMSRSVREISPRFRLAVGLIGVSTRIPTGSGLAMAGVMNLSRNTLPNAVLLVRGSVCVCGWKGGKGHLE